MTSLLHDLRYASRQLWKAKGFTATAVVTMALGIGAVSAIFSVVHAVLLEPYPFRDPGKVVVWRESIREIQNVAPVLPDNYRHYQNLKAHAKSIEDAAIVQTAGFSVSTGTDHPQMTEGLAVSPNFFSVLGIAPFVGRDFTEEEAQNGNDRVVILTWGAWQRLFHGSPSAVGSTLRIGSDAQTVVGVLPQSFRFPVVSIMPGEATHGSTERYEIFKPLAPRPSELTANDGEFNFLVIARLKPGVSPLQAQSELDGIEKATAAADKLSIHLSVIVQPFAEEITGDVKKPLWLLLAAVASVLLMACVNLANLQLARGVARDHDTALRAALGAGRRRLLQSVLAENLMIGLAGGVGGILLSDFGVKAFVRVAAVLPRLNEVHVSLSILALALAIAIVTSLGFGILPALRSLRVTPQVALQSNSTRLSKSRQAVRTRRLLVVFQIACSIMLLVVTGLIARSFSRVLSENRHFSSQRVAMAEANLNTGKYSTADVPDNYGADQGSIAREAMIDRTLEKLRSLPGVESAAVTSVMPLTGDTSVDGLARVDNPVPRGQVPMVNRRFVSPEYFDVMRIPLLAGRGFTERDRENSRVAILSEKAAKSVWPDQNPLGRKISHWGHEYTVVGVAADARINDLKRNAAVYYLPVWDFPPFNPTFLVRSSQPMASLGPEMRQSIWNVDPEVSVPTPSITSLDDMVSESVANERFQTVILSSFGGAALFLAVLGIYGVLAYSVSLRRQEFGVRLALGSDRARLARLVLRDALWPVAIGSFLGLLGSTLATRWVRTLLYETSPVDPWAIGLSVAIMGGAALAATLVPARDAMSTEPMQVLRGE